MFRASHELTVATAGSASVQDPELVLDGELQNLFVFSQSTTPDHCCRTRSP